MGTVRRQASPDPRTGFAAAHKERAPGSVRPDARADLNGDFPGAPARSDAGRAGNPTIEVDFANARA